MTSSGDIDKLLGLEGEKLLSISQSLIKNYWDYKRGNYCGIALHTMDILKMAEREPSEPMKLGHYFEYLCTGQALRDGSIPERPMTSTGKPKAEATRMEIQAQKFKDLVKEKGIVISETGTVLEYVDDDGQFKYKGVLDILGYVPDPALDEAPLSIVDVKSSGLIGDRWKDTGWDADTLNMKDKLTIQVVFYKWLAWKVLHTADIPFYFAVHSTSNEVDSVFWKVSLNDFYMSMVEFENLIGAVVADLKHEMTSGFKPYPDVKRCGTCPLNEECAYKITVPDTVEIIIDGIYPIQ